MYSAYPTKKCLRTPLSPGALFRILQYESRILEGYGFEMYEKTNNHKRRLNSLNAT